MGEKCLIVSWCFTLASGFVIGVTAVVADSVLWQRLEFLAKVEV